MKKILAILLTLSMVLSIGTAVFAAEPAAIADPGTGEELKRPNDTKAVMKYPSAGEEVNYTFFEAELGELLSGARANKDHVGFHGVGCVALTCWKTNPSATPGIVFDIYTEVAGEQDIYIGYNNGHKWAQSANLTVNEVLAGKVYFPTVELNKWPSYGMIKVKVTLNQGENQLILQYGKDDYPSSFNVDFIAVPKEGAERLTALKLVIGSKTITKVTAGGEVPVEFDVAPIVKDDRTFVPVRGIFEILGAEIGWDDSTRTATIKTSSASVSVTIDHKQALVNGNLTSLDAAPFLQDGRTLIPLRFISENLGYQVGWDEATQTVTITLN